MRAKTPLSASIPDLSASPKSPSVVPPWQNQKPARPTPRLDTLPPAVLNPILGLCAPHLRTILTLSKRMHDLTHRYLQDQCKQFRDSIEEAQCWGNREPTLVDVLHLDPMAVAAIVEDQLGRSVGGGGTPAAGAVRLAGAQKVLWKALQAALDGYNNGYATAILPIINFVHRHHLQYQTAASTTPSDDAPSDARPAPRQRDPTWLRMNRDLALHSAASGLTPLPVWSDLANPAETLTRAARCAKTSHQVATVLASARRAPGAYWRALEAGLDKCIEAGGPRDTVALLLDGVYNDQLGPYALVCADPGWGADGGAAVEAGSRGAFARELIAKADECAQVCGVPWNYVAERREFAIARIDRVLEGVFMRINVPF
ncbi:hypothetical protein BDK51DRAFT_44337 [Blyttiomyces helicus]|uniref:Uncharacterized protein n=1 Tax=Blyttiomyces helicus TaxID=388810 RepID=A0A4P9WB39_9FUNG|nr:hypothetical protein BDK51DRAFT_44337 [Blyttiomyces helicus]|eukprot:RKO89452.1 hypothetical protein BDK51DRAFT_44337 [Blyttiomyces helicus]